MNDRIALTVGMDPALEASERLLTEAGFGVLGFQTQDELVSAALLKKPSCILFFEIREVQIIRTLRERLPQAALIVIIEPDQAQLAIDALKLGATDVWCRPVDPHTQLLPLLEPAGIGRTKSKPVVMTAEMERRFATLSVREKQVMDMVVRGLLSRQIAESLEISTKTVDVHRANILKKTGANNAVELARIHAALKSQTRQLLKENEAPVISLQETRPAPHESSPEALEPKESAQE
jgi:FixJ family two-component response regulator